MCVEYINDPEIWNNSFDSLFLNSLVYAELIATHEFYFRQKNFLFSMLFSSRNNKKFATLFQIYYLLKTKLFSFIGNCISLAIYLFLASNYEFLSIIFAYSFIKNRLVDLMRAKGNKSITSLEDHENAQIEKMASVYLSTCEQDKDMQLLLDEMRYSKKVNNVRFDHCLYRLIRLRIDPVNKNTLSVTVNNSVMSYENKAST